MANIAANCVWLLTSLGGILIIVALATTNWRGASIYHEGLFQRCTKVSDADICTDVKLYDKNNWSSDLNIVRFSMISGVILIALGTLVQILAACCEKSCNVLVYIIDLLALACLITGMALYTDKFDSPVTEFKWSYYLGWAGCALYALGMLLIVFTGCKSS